MRNVCSHSFKLNADIYPESETDKADEYDSTLKAGLEFVLGKKGAARGLFYVGPFLGFPSRHLCGNRDDGVEGGGGPL